MNTSQSETNQLFIMLIGGLISLLVTITLGYVTRINKKQDNQTDVLDDHGKKFERFETLLTGAGGQSGLIGDVEELKRRTSDLDRRVGAPDRRHNIQGMQ